MQILGSTFRIGEAEPQRRALVERIDRVAVEVAEEPAGDARRVPVGRGGHLDGQHQHGGASHQAWQGRQHPREIGGAR